MGLKSSKNKPRTATVNSTWRTPLTHKVSTPAQQTELTQTEIAKCLRLLLLKEHNGRLTIGSFKALCRTQYPTILDPNELILENGDYLRKVHVDDTGTNVIAIVNMEICENQLHHQMHPEICNGLHVCKFLLLDLDCPGRCDETCAYDHSLCKPQHKRVLQKHDLEDKNIRGLQLTLRNVWPDKRLEVEKILAAKLRAKSALQELNGVQLRSAQQQKEENAINRLKEILEKTSNQSTITLLSQPRVSDTVTPNLVYKQEQNKEMLKKPSNQTTVILPSPQPRVSATTPNLVYKQEQNKETLNKPSNQTVILPSPQPRVSATTPNLVYKQEQNKEMLKKPSNQTTVILPSPQPRVSATTPNLVYKQEQNKETLKKPSNHTTVILPSVRSKLTVDDDIPNLERNATECLRSFLLRVYKGKMDIDEFKRIVKRDYPALGFSYNFVTRNNDYFQLESYGCGLEIVIATTNLKICEKHVSGHCPKINCEGLHLCKFYLLNGNCKRGLTGATCKFGHDLRQSSNDKLLKEHRLDKLTLQELNFLFRLNRSRPCYPKSCHVYNRGQFCKFGNRCIHLHCCEQYLRGKCTNGHRCTLRHNLFDMQPMSVLELYGFDTNFDEDKILQELQSGLFTVDSTNSAPVREKETQKDSWKERGKERKTTVPRNMKRKPVICLNGHCKFGKSCNMFHCNLPYQWQRYNTETNRWMNFPKSENEMTETKFSDPAIDTCYFKPDGWKVPALVSFEEEIVTLSYRNPVISPIRRLSTPNSKGFSSNEQFATVWKWYWENDNGRYMEYQDKTTNVNSETNISSADLEVEYAENPNGNAYWSSLRYRYTICFSDMVQINDSTRATRYVRRRPASHFDQDIVQADRQRWRQTSFADDEDSFMDEEDNLSFTIEEFHDEWDFEAPMKNGRYQLVKLSSYNNEDEYEMINDLFCKTMSSEDYTLREIHRIQNNRLLRNYQEFKNRMSADKSGEVKEMLLFHGTKEDNVEGICAKGFDCRLNGKTTGTRYGRGSYFAKSACFARHYTNSGQLFVARVLVGDYTVGKPEYVHPPPKNPHRLNDGDFDSCVDNMRNPERFVIFTIDQAYPAYLIDFVVL